MKTSRQSAVSIEWSMTLCWLGDLMFIMTLWLLGDLMFIA